MIKHYHSAFLTIIYHLRVINPTFMHRCLALAEQGRGRVGNGALVGAVLARGDRIIAEGFHAGYGESHAERMLLEGFGGEVLPDDVLYVNLEPCCHQGKTPPCTNLLIDRGLKTVVYGMLDPDARVAGKGIDHLTHSGVTVIGPFDRALCENLNKGFIQLRKNHRPYLTLKKAMTQSGQIAQTDGSPLKITSKEQDLWSHQFLRARHDAILVGIGTIISDDPRLNIRFDQNKEFSLQIGLNRNLQSLNNFINPLRIVLDPELKISLEAKVVADAQPDRTIICVDATGDHDSGKVVMLRERGVKVFSIDYFDGHFEWDALWQILMTPQAEFHGLASILVEGGAKTWGLFHSAGFLDQEVILTA